MIVRYVLVGLLGLTIGLILFEVYSRFVFPNRFVLSSLASFFSWAPLAYLLQRKHVFRHGRFSTKTNFAAFSLWTLAYLIQPSVGAGILFVSVQLLLIPPTIAYIFAAGISSVLGFTTSKLIFRSAETRQINKSTMNSV